MDRMKLTRDLPVDKRHGCVSGKIFDVIDIERDNARGGIRLEGRLQKVGFMSESGCIVYALLGEFEWVE